MPWKAVTRRPWLPNRRISPAKCAFNSPGPASPAGPGVFMRISRIGATAENNPDVAFGKDTGAKELSPESDADTSERAIEATVLFFRHVDATVYCAEEEIGLVADIHLEVL
jgi:hypothetical protein